jgi:isoquinoline 1-oxidoreductase beta subunit
VAAREALWRGPRDGKTGRGLSVQFAFGTYMAMVVDVKVEQGEVKVNGLSAHWTAAW